MQSKREVMCTPGYYQSASSLMVTHILRHTYARAHTHTHTHTHIYIYIIIYFYTHYTLFLSFRYQTKRRKENKMCGFLTEISLLIVYLIEKKINRLFSCPLRCFTAKD